MKRIDLNCDMGESFGAYRIGADEEVMPFITSANIACGFHAGDPATMASTVQLAKSHGVAIGAHPGLPDLQGFGRRAMAISPREVYQLMIYQISALSGFTKTAGVDLHHVKPHGALYNMAAADREIAEAIAEAVYDFDRHLILYGLAGSELIRAGRKWKLTTAQEVFADRNYEADGTLTPRTHPNSLFPAGDELIERVCQIISDQKITCRDGSIVDVEVDTICIHGDGKEAAIMAKALKEGLEQANIAVRRAENR